MVHHEFRARNGRYASDSSIEERFTRNVQIDEETGCCLWMARIDQRGYGRFWIPEHGMQLAHRVAYELFIGPIPDGLPLDHYCHTVDLSCQGGRACPHRRCVNPAHLDPTTTRENNLRSRSFAAVNARKTHCPQGHEYDEANTYVTSDGFRQCRLCNRAAKARSKVRTRGKLRDLDSEAAS